MAAYCLSENAEVPKFGSAGTDLELDSSMVVSQDDDVATSVGD
jgi:hypothetical protein